MKFLSKPRLIFLHFARDAGRHIVVPRGRQPTACGVRGLLSRGLRRAAQTILQRGRRVLGIDDCDLSWRQDRQERENFRRQWQSFIKLGASGHEHHHCDLKFGGVLLKAQVAVGGQENIEFRLGQHKVLADGHRSIPPGQGAAQTPAAIPFQITLRLECAEIPARHARSGQFPNSGSLRLSGK